MKEEPQSRTVVSLESIFHLNAMAGLSNTAQRRTTGITAGIPHPPRPTWVSIITLGELFTFDVAIQHDHILVERGLCRYVRHSSYSGLFVAFPGVGLFYVNWLSLIVLMVPITLAVINRIAKEEHVLLAALGPKYSAYCARTKRLFPGLL